MIGQYVLRPRYIVKTLNRYDGGDVSLANPI